MKQTVTLNCRSTTGLFPECMQVNLPTRRNVELQRGRFVSNFTLGGIVKTLLAMPFFPLGSHLLFRRSANVPVVCPLTYDIV